MLRDCEAELEAIFEEGDSIDKMERDKLVFELRERSASDLNATSSSSRINSVFKAAINHVMRQFYRRTHTRVDGRSFDDIRPIDIKTDICGDNLHGSAIFQRGQTQV